MCWPRAPRDFVRTPTPSLAFANASEHPRASARLHAPLGHRESHAPDDYPEIDEALAVDMARKTG